MTKIFLAILLALLMGTASASTLIHPSQINLSEPWHFPVKEFISPEQFSKLQGIGTELGFKKVLSGPKVRSSYRAEELAGDLIYA